MEQLERDVEWLKANIKHLTDGQNLMQEAIKEIADAVTKMGNIQHDIARHDDEIKLMRTRYHEQSTFLSARPCHKHTEEIARLTTRADDIEARVEVMENDLPTVKMASNWIFKALLGTTGLLGTASIGIIIHWLSGGFAQ